MVRIAVEAGMPVVPRGAGTGLSGGALPVPGCVLLGLSRMKRILEVDLDDGWIRVQPGRHQPRRQQGHLRRGLLLRAGSLLAERVHHRWQRGRELRRRALPEVRLHREPRRWACAWSPPAGEVVRPRRPGAGRARLRPARGGGGQRGHAGHRHRGGAPHPPEARGHPHLLRHLPLDRRGRRVRVGDHRQPASSRPRSR